MLDREMSSIPEQTPSQSSPPIYSHTITCFDIESGNPWTHSAVIIDEKYISPYPKAHFEPPTPRSNEEPDITHTIDQIFRNILRPMFADQLTFESQPQKELCNPHQKVEIPVTKDQYQRAVTFINQLQHNAENGKHNYSVIKPLGYSCAGVKQQILEIITKDTEHAELAKPMLFEKLVPWPQSTFNRAQHIARARTTNTPFITPAGIASKSLFKMQQTLFSSGISLFIDSNKDETLKRYFKKN